MIILKNIKKAYYNGGDETMVLKGIDLEIKKGDFLAIMGPSGSGKSTLMNMIGILDTPTSGSYTFNNTPIHKLSSNGQADFRRDTIGFVFQGYNLLPRMEAHMQVAVPLSYKGISYEKRYEAAVKVLKQVGLGDKINHTPDMLSGGQQQRVAIARAMVNNPDLILADEPTGALDSQTGEDVLTLFKKLNKQGTTIIMITHEAEVAAHADKIVHIKDGLLTNKA